MAAAAVRSQSLEGLRKAGNQVQVALRSASTVQQLFQNLTVTQPAELIGAGQFGAALLVRWPGIPYPMVVKIMGERPVGHCWPETRDFQGGMVCGTMDHRRVMNGWYVWAPGYTPSHERFNYQILTDLLVHRAATGPVPYVFFTGTFQVPQGQEQSLVDLLTDPRHRVHIPAGSSMHKTISTAHVKQRQVSVVVMEYAGVRLENVLSRCVAMQSVKLADLVFRSVVCQVLQGLLALQTLGMRHNDLHVQNVSGAPTQAKAFLYVVSVVDGHGAIVQGPRAFRVPSLGMVWRIIDYGGASVDNSGGLLGRPADSAHGLEARFYASGPWHPVVQLPRAKPTPLEAYDIVRLVTTMVLKEGPHLPAAAKHMHRLGSELCTAATALGKAPSRRGFTMSLSAVAAMSRVTPEKVRTPKAVVKVLQEVWALQRASSNTLLLWELFLELCATSGFEVTGTPASVVTPSDDVYTLVIQTPHSAFPSQPSVEAVHAVLAAVKTLIK